MDRQIGVQIEGERYIRLVNIDRESHGELKFTTIQDGQRRAIIKIFLFENDRMLLLKEIEVGGIPPDKAGVPEINLSTEFDGNKILTLYVMLNGRNRSREIVEISGQSAGRKRNLILIPVVIVIFISLFFIFKRSVFFNKGSVSWDVDKKVISEVSEKEKQRKKKIVRNEYEKNVENKKTVAVSDNVDKKQSSDNRYGKNNQPYEKETAKASGERINVDGVNKYESSSSNKVSSPQYSAEYEKQDVEANVVKEPTLKIDQGQNKSDAADSFTAQNLPTTVYFEPGRAALSPETYKKLDEMLPILKQYRDKKVIITGHCALYSTEEARQQLSVMRANNVYWYLRDQGWKPRTKPEVSGMGGLQFITTDPDSQHLNRRVEINILK